MAMRMSKDERALDDEPANPPENSKSVDFPDVELAVPKSSAREILDRLMTTQTSRNMIDKQMEFTMKLAQYEAVRNEQEVEKAEAGLLHMPSIPRPLEWMKNPGRPQLWSKLEGEGAGGNKDPLITMEQLAKITTKSNCLKYINIVVHPNLLKTWYMAPLVGQAKELGVKVVEGSGLCHRVIGVSRVIPREIISDNAKGKLDLSPKLRCCRRFLYVMQCADAVDYITSERLPELMAQRKRLLRGQLTLLILDNDNVLTKKCGPSFEMIASELLVMLEIDTLVLRSSSDLIAAVLHFAKAVAEEPRKLCRRAVDEQAEFFMQGDNKNCVTVDKQGNGLARLWQQMLSVLPQSSLEVSRAIAVDYSSPRLLAEALKEAEGVAKVADIGVTRSAVPGAKARRLGPEMSHKLQKIFTQNGDLVVE